MSFYDANIPLVSTTFDKWQVLFQNNFTQLEKAFNNNHVSLQDPSKSGNHTVIQLYQQADDTKIQTNISENALFSKNVENQTDQMFFQYQGNAEPFQYTNYQIYTVPDIKVGTKVKQKTYFTFLPGNLIVYFGSFLIESKPSVIKLTPPVCKNVVSVNITYISSSVQLATATSISFTKTQAQEGIEKDIFVESVNLNYFKNASQFLPFYYCILGNL